MKKTGTMFCLILFALTVSGMSSLAQVKLTSGVNNIVINVSNKSEMDLESIVLEVDQHKLPEGFTASLNLQQIDISAGKQSSSDLLLNISVDDNAKPGRYVIPVTLKDNADHMWDFSLDAEVELVAPLNFALHQNVPNPFNPNTHIRYELACQDEQRTRLVI